MATSTDERATVVRTSRGLSIAGTRISLYAILDYLHADWPPKLIQDWFNLTDEQLADILAYVAAHRDEVEREYQHVRQQAEADRQYWETRNCERLAHRPSTGASPEQEALRAKLRTRRVKIEQL